MVKIKINISGGPSPARRETLVKALYDAEIRVLRYYNTHDGYLTVLEDDNQAEKLFSKDVTASLTSAGFTPILPMDMRAKLTLVLKKLDRLVVNESEQDIAAEIMASAPDSIVEHVYVMKTNYLIKVRFSDHASAKQIKEKGIYLFKLYVAPWQIDFERFTPLRQCMNCYGYGHLKARCPKGLLTSCSECASPTHNYRQCTSTYKKCLNCGGNHRTFANNCAIRKKALKEAQENEKEKEKEKESKPLKAVAQKAAQETVQATTKAWKPLINQVRQDIKDTNTSQNRAAVYLALPNDLSREIMICLLHAHMQNIIAPELGFRSHAKEALKKNSLPDLDLGECDSWGILRVIQPPHKNNIRLQRRRMFSPWISS